MIRDPGPILRFPEEGSDLRVGQLAQYPQGENLPIGLLQLLQCRKDPLRRIPAGAKSIVFKVLPWGAGSKELIYIDRPE